MKKIVLMTLGGTISALGNNRLDLKDYQSGLLSGKDFLKEIPEIKELARVDVISLDNVSSTQINVLHWVQLKQKIETYLNDKNYDGVVITHGTNTIEETAYFLHLTINSVKPIVLVGAQRPFSAISSDAHLNLINAIRVAIDANSTDKGVLVVLNEQINSAREVTKTNTYRLETFSSGEIGYLGFIDADQTVQYYRSPTRRHTIHSEFTHLPNKPFPNVEIVYSYAGATGELIDYIVMSGKFSGIVVAGTGAGRFSKLEEKALAKAREKGIHVVRSSRVGNGRVVDIAPFEKLNLISGDNLNPQKARILLMLSLMTYNQVKHIQKVFNEY